jgi:hypothetical protein
MSGDAPISEFERLALDYLGTVPSIPAPNKPIPPIEPFKIKTLGRKQQLGVYLADSDERAMGYLAGSAPNKWGVFSNGSTVSELLKLRGGKQDAHRSHPLFGYIALQLLQEVHILFSSWQKLALVITYDLI